MSKYLWLIDEGHGGINPNGIYTTPPEKSKQYTFDEEPVTVYEGLTNRLIGTRLMRGLSDADIEFKKIAAAVEDTPLRDRVNMADDIYEQRKDAIYISIHSNKVSPEISGPSKGASGMMVFTSKGQTRSDVIAEIFIKTPCQVPWIMRKDMKDGDGDYEEDFYVLRKTDCPAILLECLFYDNLEQAKYLLSDSGQQTIANWIFNSILQVEDQYKG